VAEQELETFRGAGSPTDPSCRFVY